MPLDRLARVESARIEIAHDAARRWADRALVRAGIEERLRRGGPSAADAPERAQRFLAREAARARRRVEEAARGFPLVRERQIGPTLDFSAYAPDEEARRAGRPVARIVEMPGAGMLPRGFGSGFLVCPGVLITNHHVLETRADAYGVGANFLHEYAAGGLRNGLLFEFDPDALFISDEDLDFAVVAVRPTARGGESLADLGFEPLIGTSGKILVGHPVHIIQHPDGGPKQYATTQNKLLDVLETGFLHYATDTSPGSSGSPAFNQFWEVVGLHHSGVPLIQDGHVIARDGSRWNHRTMSDADIQWIANEAVRVSGIVRFLEAYTPRGDRERALLGALLRGTRDPLSETTGTTDTRDVAQRTGDSPLASSLAALSGPAFGPPGSGLSMVSSGATASAPSALNAGSPMLPVAINISGPTTINVGAAAPPPLPAPVEQRTERVLVDVSERAIRFDKYYARRRGYDRDFLEGFRIEPPTVIDARQPEMLLAPDDHKPLVLKYHHFSLAMNRDRRLQMWSAVNVDYSQDMRDNRGRKELGTDKWIPDPRIAGELQIQDDDFYAPATAVDRGHIVRREDNVWGETALEREYANADTFHWTNCTPQHEAFNQERRRGLWGELEALIKDQIGAVGNRATIIAGPVLAPDDPKQDYGYGAVQYPLQFWKVVAAVTEERGQPELRAYGFLLDQSNVVKRFGLEEIEVGRFRRYQVQLSEITDVAGVEFPDALREADVLRGDRERRFELRTRESVQFRPAMRVGDQRSPAARPAGDAGPASERERMTENVSEAAHASPQASAHASAQETAPAVRPHRPGVPDAEERAARRAGGLRPDPGGDPHGATGGGR